MITTICPHCENEENTHIAEITYCSQCSNPFVCIDVYCASTYYSLCGCYNYILQTPYLGIEKSLSQQNELPAYLKADKPLNCFHCGHSWGLQQAVIFKRGETEPRPFVGHLIVPLEEHTCLQLFHGTIPDRLESIRANGLRPPTSLMDKSHGFKTEGSLRYTGRDLAPAKNHSVDDCIIELTYSGLIAVTSLTCVAEELNLLLDNLPKNIGGVQYLEDGKSIAFRPEALLCITKMPPSPKKEGSWFTKLWEVVCKAF